MHAGAVGKAAVLAMVCVAVLVGSASARLTNSRITLGQSIGSVRLGMTKAQVRQLLGRGTPIGSKYKHRLTESYGKLGLTVQFGTGKAVGIGRSTQAEVQAAYPAAHCISSNGSYSCEVQGAFVHPGIARFTGLACSEEGEHDVISIAVGFGHP